MRRRGRGIPACSAASVCKLQSRAFFEKLTAREQLRTFADLFGASPNRPDDLLALVGLTESADVRTGEMSGGQAQRLSIACALVHEPELVFLDEPTGALDPQSRRNLSDTIRQIREDGATVVLTTHSMEEAEELCDRVAIVDAGRILVSGRPAMLVRDLEARSGSACPRTRSPPMTRGTCRGWPRPRSPPPGSRSTATTRGRSWSVWPTAGCSTGCRCGGPRSRTCSLR